VTPLLVSPYLHPTDAARLAKQVQFLRGLVAGVLLGWTGCLSFLTAIKLGVLP
jgi:hypothetical protein